MDNRSITVRLHEAIASVCPIEGVSIAALVPGHTRPEASIQYAATATAQQRQAAEALLAAFDWSDRPTQPTITAPSTPDGTADVVVRVTTSGRRVRIAGIEVG